MTPASRRPSTWKPVAAADRAWHGITFTRAFLGLDLPGRHALRAATAALTADAPHLVRWHDDQACSKPVAAGELDAWVDGVLRFSDEHVATTEQAMQLAVEDLGHLPFCLVVGPDWTVLRTRHLVLDGWSANQLVGHLVRRAQAGAPVPVEWRVMGQARRDLLTAHLLLTRPRAVASALRNRAQLRGGSYVESGATPCARLYPSVATGIMPQLREIRERHHPGASTAALVYVGLRRALGEEISAMRPGFECLFDVRGTSGRTRNALGNWSAGVYLAPEDDLSPIAVTRSMGQCRDNALPQLAGASLRLKAWRRTPSPIRTPQREGAARLTFSFSGAHAMDGVVPGMRPAAATVRTKLTPNGSDTIVIEAITLGADLHLSISFDPAAWDGARVSAAAECFLATPGRYLAGVGTAVPA